jgi:ABC-2 type transport system ATP-binding protein
MIIETNCLSKSYGAVNAVKDLRLIVPGGGISAFLGPNGHGKTTTIKMLLGMVHPTSGAGRVLGLDITDARESLEIRRRTGFVSEDKQIYPYMTARQLLTFTRRFYPLWRIDRERELIRRFELPMDRRVKQLSKGMRTKLALVLALARGAELLILDEPSEGLDPVMTERMLHAVVEAAGEGTTVFFSSHQLSEAERIADHVFILNRGSVVMSGPLDELRDRYRRVNAVFVARPPAEDLTLDLLNVQVEGNVLTGLAKENVGQLNNRLRAAGAVTVDAHPVGLRELFLEAIKERQHVA